MDVADSQLLKISDLVLKFSKLLDLILSEIESKGMEPSKPIDPTLLDTINKSDYLVSGEEKIAPNFLQVIVITLIKSFSTRISLDFQKSVLAGEHYFKHSEEEIKKIEESIEEFKKTVNKLNLINLKYKALLLGSVQTSYIASGLSDFLNLFKRLVKFVILDLDFSAHVEPIFVYHEDVVSQEEIQKITDQIPTQNIAKPFLKYFSLFQINVKIASIDDNIGCSLSVLYELIKIKNYLASDYFRSDRIAEILSDKCKYLIKKVFYSFHERGSDLINDSDPSGIKIKDYVVEDFKLFEKNTITQYFDSEFKKAVEFQVYGLEKKINDNNYNPPLLFREVYFLSKYYQENILTIEDIEVKIDNLLKYFQEAYHHFLDPATSNFDRQAYKTTLIFLKNKKLYILSKLALKSLKAVTENFPKDGNIKTIVQRVFRHFHEYFEKNRKEQEEEIRNYYPFYVFCSCYSELIKIFKDLSGRIHISFNLVEDYIIEFRKYYRIASKNIDWCENKHYSLLYMPYSECFDKAIFDKKTKKTIDIFLDSSFILPVDYKDKRRLLTVCLEDFTDNRVLLVNSLLATKTKDIESISADLKTKTDEVELRLSKQDEVLRLQDVRGREQYTGHIQLLAVFAAIIAFVTGSISVIPRFKSTLSVFVFMIAFACALSGFVITIKVIVVEKKLRLRKLIVGLISIVIVCGIILWITNSPIDYDDSKTQITNSVSPQNSQWQQLLDTCCPSKSPAVCSPHPGIKKNDCDSVKRRLEFITDSISRSQGK